MSKYNYLLNNFVSPYNFLEQDYDIFFEDNNILNDNLLNKLIINANIYTNKNNKKIKNFSKKNIKKRFNNYYNNTKKYRNRLSKKNLKYKQSKNNISNKKITLKY